MRDIENQSQLRHRKYLYEYL